jgi:hypothetical protein
MFVGGKYQSFIIGKGEGITGASLPGGMEVQCAETKREEFLLQVVFISSLTWR